MSRPIDIPGRSLGYLKPIREDSSFSAEDGPYFGFIEITESGEVHWAVSSGFDQYITVGPKYSLPPLAFIVEKDLQTRTITIEITSLELKQCLYRGILGHSPSSEPCDLDFDAILQNYDAIKLHCDRQEARYPHDDATAEISLLVKDLLLEKSLYDGIGVEQYRQKSLLSLTHLEDIHQRNLDIGLDEIEDCFILGLVPDRINDEYMEAVNSKYAELARAGDLSGLQNLCEPIVRSGEVSLQYNPSLLLEVVEAGHIDVYLYMLDLIDRTRDGPAGFTSLHDSDVTYDPFYVAIRLGQLDIVHAFIRDKNTFEGHVVDGSDGGQNRIVTPLNAAVHWRQPRIVRLLLRSSPIYHAGYQQAVAQALAEDMEEIITIFTEHEQQATPDTVVTSKSWLHQMEVPRASQPPRSKPRHDTFIQELELSRSVSEITNGLVGTQSDQAPLDNTYSFLAEDLIDPQLLLPGTLQDVHGTSSGHIDSSRSRASGNAHQQNENETQPFMRQRMIHSGRRKLGRSLVMRLENRCNRLRACCEISLHSHLCSGVAKDFMSMEHIWESGIETFRGITRNQIPSTLVQVLHCLLVADALCQQISPQDDRLYMSFVNDIGRWRTFVHSNEVPAFDLLVQAIWEPEQVSDMQESGMEVDELYHFQELIQNLVFLQSLQTPSTGKGRRLGRRLRNISNQIQSYQTSMILQVERRKRVRSSVNTFQNIGDVLGKLTMDTDSMDEDDIDLGDFLHLDALQEEQSDSEQEQPQGVLPRTPWKDIGSMVVLLLASVAFSIVLVMVSAVQDGPRGELLQPLVSGPPGYGRSCAVIEDLLDFRVPWHPSFPVQNTQGKTKQRSFIAHMKASSQRASRTTPLSQSLATSIGSYKSTLRASMSSPSGSSFLSTDFSSDGARDRERLRCLSVKCPKTFSSISNRNKHMREGCAFREKKGYRCRHDKCTKVLTTKWYRNTHEQTRCRFRPAA